MALEKDRHLEDSCNNLFEVLLRVWQVWLFKAEARGGREAVTPPLCGRHHDNNGFNSGLPSILQLLEEEENEEGKQGGGVKADSSVNSSAEPSPLADNRTNPSLFSILQSQTLWWGLEKAIGVREQIVRQQPATHHDSLPSRTEKCWRNTWVSVEPNSNSKNEKLFTQNVTANLGAKMT